MSEKVCTISGITIENIEIEFRAYDTINKRMLNNVSTGTVQIFDGEFSALAKDCIFMQFIGLLDKHETKIFEDDIVIIHNVNKNDKPMMFDCVVKRFGHEFRPIPFRKHYDGKSWTHLETNMFQFYSYFTYESRYVEVIGTIHDHLLKA